MSAFHEPQELDIILERQIFGEEFTLGVLYVGMQHFGYTCEDKDRRLEDGGEKVYGQSAIPRGRYRLTTSMSQRFGKVLPIVLGVPTHTGVRVHGGNTAADTSGCPLLGRVRTISGVANCAERVQALTKLIQDTEANGDTCWLEVK
jgi:hypothetical protein